MSEDAEYLKCPCKECGNNVEFPAHMVRRTITCPHCGEWTELIIPGMPEPAEPGEGTNVFTIALFAVIILVLVAGVFYFTRPSKTPGKNNPAPLAQTKAAAPKTNSPVALAASQTNDAATNATPAEDPDKSRPKSPDDLKLGDIKLEKTQDSSLVYAVGTVKNNSAYQRFGVKIMMDVLNKNGKKIGTTQDYKDVIEPHKDWLFHALIPEKRAASAKMTSLKED